ncbi:hypothetical protein [Paractinoplanes rishiriensis]|uniref:Uncharacterized protein n=1 Tax=Paractinoplanes rishiriensis TaxID=1050105 RepID=A0A919MZ30_9ACTN|nr:hypothetical protein [Actinoplanes rishiriensis]GIE97790.1 hypothetical protein Ari01nite_52550 [Actinoplanes rishiriensis]
MTSAVLEEALKKAALAWVSVGDGPALGLWCMPLDGSLIVVSGPGEQFAPDLAGATRATVRLRGDSGGLIVVSEMAVSRLAPGSDEWTEVAPQLAQKRLNASGTADEVVARWAESGCAVVRLTPSDQDTAVGAPDLPSESGVAPPRETPARVETRRPFRLHRVRRR